MFFHQEMPSGVLRHRRGRLRRIPWAHVFPDNDMVDMRHTVQAGIRVAGQIGRSLLLSDRVTGPLVRINAFTAQESLSCFPLLQFDVRRIAVALLLNVSFPLRRYHVDGKECSAIFLRLLASPAR